MGETDTRPRVVVVMPAYNAGRTLRMTYEELPKDTVSLVILVDDGSTDTTLEVGRLPPPGPRIAGRTGRVQRDPASGHRRSGPAPLIQQLRDERAKGWYRVACMDRSILPPNTSAWFGLDDIRGYDLPIAQRYVDFLRHGFYGGTWPFEAFCCDLGVIDDGQRRLLQIMGVRHLLMADRRVTYTRDLPGAFPHVFWAEWWRTCQRGESLVEGRGRLHARQVSVNTVAVDVDVIEPGILVLNEMPIQGWRIHVDGRPAAIAPVNVIQTGVWLETGHHSVEFSFRPRGARLGGIVSLCGLAAMLALVVGVWKPTLVRRDRRP
jgi:hypothetical protein